MRIHIVQKGDTLWNIAKKYGVDFEQLKSMNTQLSNPDMIMPGMKIKVPQGTKQVKKEAQKQPAAKKEMPKQPAPKKEKPSQPPYKDTSPKPIPSIKEDEKKPAPKGVMEKPMQPMKPINMNMPITMPSIDQQMQNYYTTFHLPQMPMPQSKEEYSEESPKSEVKDTQTSPMPKQPYNQTMPEQHYNQQMPEQHYNQPMQPQQHYNQPMQQPYSQPMQPQLVHTDFYCCPPHPVMMPMNMPMQHQQPMPMQYPMHMMGDEESYDDMVQGVQAGSDCGCGGGGGSHNPQAYGPMMGPMGGYPPQGYPQSWQQTPYGGMQQHPMGYGQPHPQQMGWGQQPQQGWGLWNPQPMGQGYQQEPWRDDDVDES